MRNGSLKMNATIKCGINIKSLWVTCLVQGPIAFLMVGTSLNLTGESGQQLVSKSMHSDKTKMCAYKYVYDCLVFTAGD